MAEPVGEDSWLALVDEASRTAGDIEQRIGVVELYKRAVAAEPWSTKLWLARCEWVWSLHTDCQNGDAGWPEDEQLLGQEIFSEEIGIEMWQEGAQATQYRLNDSHELWNRWMSIEMLLLATRPTTQRVERIKSLFLQRLQVPHTTWEETSTLLSSFLTKHDERSYEDTMVTVTKLARPAKDLYAQREPYELQLAKAKESGNVEALKSTMRSYLEWEAEQALVKPKRGVSASPPILCVALYERALSSTPFGIDAAVWEDYIVYLTTCKNDPHWPLPAVLSVLQRATNHCPWSGALWARYILRAEFEKSDFETMERIKHAATDNRSLDRDGMDSVVEFYSAWCGFLKRRTMVLEANDDDADIAEMGLRSALESVQEWGQRRHGKTEWKGDPLFRIERVFIQHLTQQMRYDEARQTWRKLVTTHGDGYEFWQQFYLWEMTIRSPVAPPTAATDVLKQSVGRRTLDWPEKMMEVYVRHCNNYEDVNALLQAMSTVHRLSKIVARRREVEAAEAAALYAQQQPQTVAETAAEADQTNGSKRKRESEPEEGGATKKVKSAAEQDAIREQQLKRDRENTTILVTNLPPDVTQTKVRQYFKDYGHVNSMTLRTETDKSSTTALIEFRSTDDVKSAQLRDGKYFGDRQIHVEPAAGLTLYVTNYPPTADDVYLKNIFKDCGEIFSIRWPSLKHNTHRRFCYISFRTAAAAAAATELDGRSLGGVYKLVAKYSDPANKKDREGAMAEGREVHITGIDSSITEDDLKEVFSKYGKVDKARILKTLGGESKGAAFVSFEKKEEATASLELDKTKLKSKILTVEISTGKNFKPTATVYGKGSSASPAPDADGDYAMSPASTSDGHNPSRQELTNRTMILMNIPDTVNVERIRAIAEPYGEIVKLVLRPDHQGAIIEFSDPTSAGKAALGLANHEIAPGRLLRTGDMKELLSQKDEYRNDRIQVGPGKKSAPALMAPPPPVKRPVGPGGRGGLGQKKRGLGFSGANTAAPSAGASQKVVNGNGEEAKKPKSNSDFRNMFVSGGTH